MARNKIVTPDKVVGVIESADAPFATTKTVAEKLDVTAQAVRNNEGELMAADELHHGQISRSTVYWLAEAERPGEVEPPAEPPDPEREPTNTPVNRDSDDGKGILNRLFDGLPALSASTGLLAVWTALVGLSFGVGLSTLLFEPPVGVALLAVWGLLVAALVALGVATVHELQTDTKQATIGADAA